MMGYHSFSRWPSRAEAGGKQFSEAIENLAHVLRAALEARVDQLVEWHNGSASLRQIVPNKWSKYKLVPYDSANRPIRGIDEGVLLCIDQETLEGALRNDESMKRYFGCLHPDAFIYQVGSGTRSYRSIPFSLSEDSEARHLRLLEVGRGITALESVD